MSALSRIVITAFFSSASRCGVAVHGSCVHGRWSTIICFSCEGLPPFTVSEQLSPVLALVASQPAKPCCSRNLSILALPIFIPPTSICEKTNGRGTCRSGAFVAPQCVR